MSCSSKAVVRPRLSAACPAAVEGGTIGILAVPVWARSWSNSVTSSNETVSTLIFCAGAGVGIFGTKAGMMTYFTAQGTAVPATVIALEEGNYITMVKTTATDGYDAVQVGYKVVAERKVRKPELGHLNKSNCPPLKHLREFKVCSYD